MRLTAETIERWKHAYPKRWTTRMAEVLTKAQLPRREAPVPVLHFQKRGDCYVGTRPEAGVRRLLNERQTAAVLTVFDPDKGFDLSLLSKLEKPVIIWGAQDFSEALPASSCWLVWDAGDALSTECLLAWTNLPGNPRLFHSARTDSVTSGTREQSQLFRRLVPPPRVMEWCLRISGVQRGDRVVDPFATTDVIAIACLRFGALYHGVAPDEETRDRLRPQINALRDVSLRKDGGRKPTRGSPSI